MKYLCFGRTARTHLPLPVVHPPLLAPRKEVMELKDDFQKNLPRSAEYRECLDVSRRKTKSPKIEGDPNNFCCTKLTTFRHISLRAVWPGPGLECF